MTAMRELQVKCAPETRAKQLAALRSLDRRLAEPSSHAIRVKSSRPCRTGRKSDLRV